ncbi:MULTISPECIES: hypothetical protein [unclassified Phenylobacterium]|uniref:hypothetical protein n=1 Tax=unclassified Phenylobacterium TaxID=2640670 RepID=UPI00083B27E0|nr:MULTISPECIES: hypothetical protein [unclassified Phenylobacterium]
MSLDILLGMFAIAAVSVVGFGALSAGGLMGRLSPRARRIMAPVGGVLYGLLLSALVYHSLLMERGMVERGHMSETTALWVWAGLSALIAIVTVRRIARTFSQSNDDTGTGASA